MVLVSSVQIDTESGCVYVTVSEETYPQLHVARTESVHERVNLDFAEDGTLIGVEIL